MRVVIDSLRCYSHYVWDLNSSFILLRLKSKEPFQRDLPNQRTSKQRKYLLVEYQLLLVRVSLLPYLLICY